MSEQIDEGLEYHLNKIKILSKFTPLKEWFLGREFRSYRNESSGLAWNIKVGSCDTSGHKGSSQLNKDYDKLWEKYLEDKDEFFYRCCEDGLGFVGDKKHRQWNWNDGIPEIEKCDYELYQAGRSGGWLVLSEFDGVEIAALKDNVEDFIQQVEDYEIDEQFDCADEVLDEMEGNVDLLEKLEIFCESLDKFDATVEWNEQCNSRRSQIEHDWDKNDFYELNDTDLEEFLGDEEISEKVKNKIKDYLNNQYSTQISFLNKKMEVLHA